MDLFDDILDNVLNIIQTSVCSVCPKCTEEHKDRCTHMYHQQAMDITNWLFKNYTLDKRGNYAKYYTPMQDL